MKSPKQIPRRAYRDWSKTGERCKKEEDVSMERPSTVTKLLH